MRSQELNQLILDSSRDCIQVLDRQGYVLSINAGGCRAFELMAAEEVLSAWWPGLWPEEQRSAAVAALALANDGQRSDFTGFCPTALSNPKWWEVQVTPISSAEGLTGQILINARDITSRKKAEIEAHEAKERLALALHSAQIGTWTWDLISDRVTEDERCPALFGLPSHHYLTDIPQFLDVVHPDDRDRVEEALQRALGTGHYQEEYRVIWPDGSLHFLAASAAATFKGTKAVKLSGATWDVTARVKAEEALRASESRLKEAQEIAHVGHWEVELDSREVKWSDETYRIFGLPPQSGITFEKLRSMVPENDREEMFGLFRKSAETGNPHMTMHGVMRPDGTLGYVEARARFERGANGRPAKLLGTSLDVTARIAAEQNLRSSHEELEVRIHERTDLLALSNAALMAEVKQHKLTQSIVSGQNKILRLIAEGAPIQEAFDTLLEFGEKEAGGGLIGAILLKTEDGKHLRWAAAPRLIAAIRAELPQIPVGPGNGTSGLAAYTGKQEVICDMMEQTGWPGAALFHRYFGAQSIASTPIRGKDNEILGTVSFCMPGKSPTAYELQLQDACASLAAVALLRDQERSTFRFLADLMPQMVWTTRADGWVEYFNEKWFSYTGMTLEQTQGWGWEPVLHPDDLQMCLEAWTKSLATGMAYEVEYRFKRASDGAYRWHVGKAVPFRNRSGEIVNWFGTCIDVHEQKTEKERLEAVVQTRTEQLRRSLGEKETLLKEVHHRVKNNLQVISSLLRMQCEGVADENAAAALRESRQRVLSMALIHERLYSHEMVTEIDFAEYTAALVGELIASYTGKSGGVVSRVDASGVQLNVDQAIPCGLILNELVTNALKYAYPEQGSGEICVEVKEGAPGRVRLMVADQGVGLPKGMDWRGGKTLGLPIVSILAEQLGGTVRLVEGNGATFIVEFPLGRFSGVDRAA